MTLHSDDRDRQRRHDAVRYAVASTMIEGGTVTPDTQALLDRWVAGDLDDGGLLAAVLANTKEGER